MWQTYFDSLSTLGIVAHVVLGAVFGWWLCAWAEATIRRVVYRRRVRRVLREIPSVATTHPYPHVVAPTTRAQIHSDAIRRLEMVCRERGVSPKDAA